MVSKPSKRYAWVTGRWRVPPMKWSSPPGGSAFVGSIQTKREVFRAAVQATLESIRIAASQRERVLPVLMKQFSLTQDDVGFVYDIVQKGFALDGRPTPGSQKFEFDLAQKELGLKEPPRPEQVY